MDLPLMKKNIEPLFIICRRKIITKRPCWTDVKQKQCQYAASCLHHMLETRTEYQVAKTLETFLQSLCLFDIRREPDSEQRLFHFFLVTFNVSFNVFHIYLLNFVVAIFPSYDDDYDDFGMMKWNKGTGVESRSAGEIIRAQAVNPT